MAKVFLHGCGSDLLSPLIQQSSVGNKCCILLQRLSLISFISFGVGGSVELKLQVSYLRSLSSTFIPGMSFSEVKPKLCQVNADLLERHWHLFCFSVLVFLT